MRRALPSLLVVLAVLAGAAPAADAASRLVIRGAGFGHGIGMSQYGAYGFALQGSDHRAILSHYYTDTTLGRLSRDPEVRVLLAGTKGLSISGAVAAGSVELDPVTTYRVTAGAQGVVLRGGDEELTASVLRVQGEGALQAVGGTWRGALELRPAGGGVQVVNALGMEDYVRGVVALESPSSWPLEALRAQAIAARTYAATTSKNGNGFDQYRDTRSQVYGGVAAETEATDLAVETTRGVVVTQGGVPVTTFFFSTSGGQTEDLENSFLGGEPRPWLRSVPDPFDDVSPKHRWSMRLTMAQAQKKLGNLVRGRFKRIKVLSRGSSPRVVRAEVIGTRGRVATTGPVLRARLGLFDTWATFTTVSSSVRARAARAGGSPDARAADVRGSLARVIEGRIEPARRGAHVRLQRRDGARWVTVAGGTIGRGGRYAVTAPEPGAYRIAYGRAVPGPTVLVGR